MTKTATIAALLTASLLSACATTPGQQSQLNCAGATVAGAVAGAALGNQIGDGSGNDIATAGGAVAGGLAAGNAVGC